MTADGDLELPPRRTPVLCTPAAGLTSRTSTGRRGSLSVTSGHVPAAAETAGPRARRHEGDVEPGGRPCSAGRPARHSTTPGPSAASRSRTALTPEVTGSGVGCRLDGLEVAYGVAVVLPLLLEDHMQAREVVSGYRGPSGFLRVAASSSGVTVARKSRTIATRPARTSSTSAYDGATAVKIDMSEPSSSAPGPAWPMGWNGCSISRIPGAATRPWPRPGAAASAQTTTRRPPKDRACQPASPRPARAWPPRCVRAWPKLRGGQRDLRRAVGAAGKAAVEFGLYERDDVDAVDPQELAVEGATGRRCPCPTLPPRASRRRTGHS